MSKEMEWWLTEQERKTLMTEINALKKSDKALVMEFIRELLENRKPT
tara:strand:- start:1847 stop:1987 length:141 start_codon:yes stop_codon:yes gene_type:complete